MPGRKSMILYCPESSVTTARTFSISAGLDASTVTPGNTAPEASFTTPASEACAHAAVGQRTTNAANRAADLKSLAIVAPLFLPVHRRDGDGPPPRTP